MKYLNALAGIALAAGLSTQAQADKLDDIIASGTLRCAVVLDFPPMGSRDASNNPIGFDVDYCNDLAAALGVTAEIVETPFPELSRLWPSAESLVAAISNGWGKTHPGVDYATPLGTVFVSPGEPPASAGAAATMPAAPATPAPAPAPAVPAPTTPTTDRGATP